MEELTLEDEELLQELLPKIISRQEWGAVESKRKRKLRTPVKRLIFTRATTTSCYSKFHCMHNIRKQQREAFEESRPDIPHSFIIDRYGKIYEIMGWNYEANCTFSYWFPSERDLKALYESSIEVALIGDKEQKPSILQIKAALGLLMVGIQNDYLMENLDIVESDSIRGPVIPSEEIIAQLSNGNNGNFTGFNEETITEAEVLRLVNKAHRKENKPQITVEEMREEMKDSERLFKEFDEQLKLENQKYIEKNYPWAFDPNKKYKHG
ncbi:peptidoglycan recognition protein 1-like [Macrosteles quadrilineatus]|uniref:peptidoglycan recognition protein 1-like n=1 Tax=Macrosteles quadrilineatus TaxID=74068 RepID=UPI0023E29875|nr:peptidoglycan recognition protein 1-like [Macrosteles quadrilineatus]